MSDTFTTLPALFSSPQFPSRIYNASAQWKAHLHTTSIHAPLDRVNVLGDDTSGHRGCVNALSWARNGELLLTAGDDTTVRLWRMDPSDTSKDYPFVCDAEIRTGHRGNIFNCQLLPHSARVASVARDRQVRISDIGDCLQQHVSGKETVYSTRQTNLRVLKCHTRAVKRIVTEDSPDIFLTVAEDGTVRQHDLRQYHTCGDDGACPAPLVKMRHDLSTLSMSPLRPYQFVVAGESPYGYLFDRRQCGRYLEEEWGMAIDDKDLTTCIRRFGRKSAKDDGHEHITGARMANSNVHEVLLSYSGDAVYLYSTLDDATESSPRSESSILPVNQSRGSPRQTVTASSSSGSTGISISDALMEQDIDMFMDLDTREDDELSSIESTEDNGYEDEDTADIRYRHHVPVVYPRTRYAGACNVQTVKDVNFLGPREEFVVSGSDDGHWFMWDKMTGELHDIFEGDGSVVNVIEGHPHLPLVAVSGIDTTVKLFAPSHRETPRRFSRMQNSATIIEHNSTASSNQSDRISIAMYSLLARRRGEVGGCEQQ